MGILGTTSQFQQTHPSREIARDPLQGIVPALQGSIGAVQSGQLSLNLHAEDDKRASRRDERSDPANLGARRIVHGRLRYGLGCTCATFGLRSLVRAPPAPHDSSMRPFLLLILLTACANPTAPKSCTPMAFVRGYNIVTVTAECDTIVKGSIIPPPGATPASYGR